MPVATASLFDTTFSNSIGIYTLYAAILFIILSVVLQFSPMFLLPASCPTWSGVTYYSIPIGY